MKAILRSLLPATATCAALVFLSAGLHAQPVVQPTTPPWKWLWVGSDNPVDTWGSANSRNAGALTGNWLLFPNDTPAPPITRPRTGSDLVVIDPGQSSFGTLGEVITGELNARIEPQAGWTVGRAVLAAGTSLTLQGNSTLIVTTTPAAGYATFSGAGSIDNRGDIRIGSGGYLAMAAAGTISGTGTITLSPANETFGASTLGGDNNNTTFSIAAGQTVRGSGNIRGGANFSANLGNAGLIDANLNGKSIDLFTNSSSNSGTLRASNGGTLRIFGQGTVQNAGGRIEALDQSIVRVDSGATIVGGTLATSGSGAVRGSGGGAFLRGVTNTGLIQLGDNTSSEFLVLVDSFTNTGTVRVGAPNLFSSNLLLQTSIALNSGSRIVLSSNGGVTISATQPNLTLTNPSGATIEGGGNVSGNGGGFGGLGSPHFFQLVNAGVIEANRADQSLNLLMFDAGGGTLTNTGTLRASGGAALLLFGSNNNPGGRGSYLNTGGRIEALDGSTVQIRPGAYIQGGTLGSSGSGEVRLGFPGQYNGGIARDVTNTGNLGLFYGIFEGQILNTGAVRLQDGEFTFSAANFLNQAGATFASINGTRLSGSGTFTNAGTFTRSGTSFSTMQDTVSFVNTGTVVLEGFQQFGNFTQSAGTLRFGANGTTQTASGQPLVFTGGSISGTGSFQTSVVNNGALTVGATDGTATSLTFLQNYTQAANATLTVNVAGTNAFGMLKVNGTATLAGTVSVQLVNGFRFRVGDAFQIVTAGTRVGSFDSIAFPAGVTGTLSASGGNVTVTITAAPAATSLVNLSTRARVETGDNVLIGGFVIGGTAAKKVIVRAIGPSLTAFGVSGALSNPTLRLVDSAAGVELAANDNWRSAQQAEIAASGFAPNNDNESAIVATLQPGSYTAIVSGVGGENGVGLVEVYDLDRGGRETARPLNVSTRARVLTGDNILIGGFVVEGARERRVIVRAIGPSLTAFGVQGAVPNPTLVVKDANGTTVGSNDDWKSAQQAAISASGFAPSNDNESALILTLPPGAYTALVSGVAGATGVGLVEVYDLE